MGEQPRYHGGNRGLTWVSPTLWVLGNAGMEAWGAAPSLACNLGLKQDRGRTEAREVLTGQNNDSPADFLLIRTPFLHSTNVFSPSEKYIHLLICFFTH